MFGSFKNLRPAAAVITVFFFLLADLQFRNMNVTSYRRQRVFHIVAGFYSPMTTDLCLSCICQRRILDHSHILTWYAGLTVIRGMAGAQTIRLVKHNNNKVFEKSLNIDEFPTELIRVMSFKDLYLTLKLQNNRFKLIYVVVLLLFLRYLIKFIWVYVMPRNATRKNTPNSSWSGRTVANECIVFFEYWCMYNTVVSLTQKILWLYFTVVYQIQVI